MEFSSNSMSDNSFDKDNPMKQVLQLCSTLAGKGCDFSISVRIRDCFSFSLKSGKPQPQQAVFFSLASDRMRDSFSSPSCLGASHFSMKTKKNLLSSQISRIHNLFQLMLNRVAKLALKGCLCRNCCRSWNWWKIPCWDSCLSQELRCQL